MVLREDNKAQKIAFVTYYKGEYGIHTVPVQKEPLHTVASADFGAPGPIIDFQAPLSHTLVKANARQKGRFEKLFLEGRPPVNVGVTSSGDFFGGTQVTFTDVLGDQQFNIYAESVSQYRSFSVGYLNLSRRLQYSLQGFSLTQFYYANDPGTYYAAQYGFLSHSDAISTQSERGGTAFGIYPLNRYARLEVDGRPDEFQPVLRRPDPAGGAPRLTSSRATDRVLFANGNFMPLGLAYVRETTVFREYGPLSGTRSGSATNTPPKLSDSFIYRQTVDLDARKYIRLASNGVLAFRFRGLRSWGDYPSYLYFGGNSGNARLRLPAVPRQPRFLCRRRTALPPDRSGADADRRGRRPARRSPSPTSAARKSRRTSCRSTSRHTTHSRSCRSLATRRTSSPAR